MRSATEINANKDIELTGNEANLVAYYKFNDGSGQIATDQSSTTNNAVLGSSNTAYTDDPSWVKVNHAITSVSSYRYGFNGMEKDNSIKGEGNSLDFGARIYDPRLGRWLALDPLMAEFPSQTPYHYTSNSPIGKVDVGGKWDIEVHAYKNRKKYGYAIMIVKERKGNEVYRTKVRVNGNKSKIGLPRTTNKGDTPTGRYKILEWRPSGNERYNRESYGPNDLLALRYEHGEGEGKRQHMHVHGGRQEVQSDGKWKRKKNPTLWNTSGCFRIDDQDLAKMKKITEELEKNDLLEKKGNLTLSDDLIKTENSGYVISSNEFNPIGWKPDDFELMIMDFIENINDSGNDGGASQSQEREKEEALKLSPKEMPKL